MVWLEKLFEVVWETGWLFVKRSFEALETTRGVSVMVRNTAGGGKRRVCWKETGVEGRAIRLE